MRRRKAKPTRLAREMFVLGNITELDRAALAAYCQAYGRWVEAERKLSSRQPAVSSMA